MVYVVSFIIYVIILGIGVAIAKKAQKIELYGVVVSMVGFAIQVFINWAALGNIPSMPQISNFSVTQHGLLDLIILSMVSVFCYAALLVIIYKAHDYYHHKTAE